MKRKTSMDRWLEAGKLAVRLEAVRQDKIAVGCQYSLATDGPTVPARSLADGESVIGRCPMTGRIFMAIRHGGNLSYSTGRTTVEYDLESGTNIVPLGNQCIYANALKMAKGR